VELNGLRIGKVRSVSGIVGEDASGVSRVLLNAVVSIQPARLGLQDDVTPDAAFDFLSQRINEGLRARLASAGLLSSGLKIELVQIDNAPSYEVESGPGIVPVIPTTKSDISDAAATVEGVVSRINNLPIEELMFSAIQLLNSSESLISDTDLRETPQDLRALLSDVRGIVTSQDVQNIPVTLNATISRFETLLTQLEEGQLASKLVAALDAASKAADGVNSSVEGVPALVVQLQTIAAKAESLPLVELTTQLTALTSSADQILGTEAARHLPVDLGAALIEINATLAELRKGGAVTNINATLDSTRKAADAVAVATQDLPTLVGRIQRVLTQASTTIEGYNKGDVISRDAQAALRDISQAADAMTSLARMLERNPNSLIRGR
jgi:paraquat-inducible protein B